MMKKCFLVLLGFLVSCTNKKEVLLETNDFIEERILISEKWKVEGILTQPIDSSNEVVVLMLSGSGINDADYTVNGIKLYQELAHGLVQSGIASFRMNKRNIPVSEYTSIQEEIIEDAQTALEVLKKRYRHIIVLGHSLSSLVLPVFSKEADALILLATGASELEEIYAKQLLESTSEQEKTVILDELTTILNLHEDSGFSWFGIQESYWLSLDQLDLSKRRKELNLPILILHGSEDEQISVSEIEQLKTELNPKYTTYVIFENVDHYLLKKQANHLEDSIIQTIVSWILEESSVIIKVRGATNEKSNFDC